LGVKSLLAVPIAVNRDVIGHMVILTVRKRCEWPEALIRKIRHFGDLFANAYVRKRSEEAYLQAHEEIKRIKYRLESDAAQRSKTLCGNGACVSAACLEGGRFTDRGGRRSGGPIGAQSLHSPFPNAEAWNSKSGFEI
jgi:hypothetical protein